MTTLITLSELATHLQTTAGALKTRYNRNPLSLPPVVKLPGDRRLLFCANQVDRWLNSFVVTTTPTKRGPGRPRKGSSQW